jgi:hypothetical protein
MTEPDLRGCAILIVQKDVPTALDLQDAFAESGARLLTSYRPASALMHARSSQISAAVIDASIAMEERNAICERLATRNVPFVLFGQQMTSEGAGCLGSLARPREALERIAEFVRGDPAWRDDGRERSTGPDSRNSSVLQ